MAMQNVIRCADTCMVGRFVAAFRDLVWDDSRGAFQEDCLNAQEQESSIEKLLQHIWLLLPLHQR